VNIPFLWGWRTFFEAMWIVLLWRTLGDLPVAARTR
jgi:hypothetical protein